MIRHVQQSIPSPSLSAQASDALTRSIMRRLKADNERPRWEKWWKKWFAHPPGGFGPALVTVCLILILVTWFGKLRTLES